MKFIRGQKNQAQLEALNKEALAESDAVWAAVAYVSDDRTLLLPCLEQRIPLRLWARYDYSLPVRVDILRWFLGKSPLCTCKLVPDIFHPKVIWWRSYGVYIGSANLTDSAWFRNFEAGVFIPDDELDEYEVKPDLEDFFSEVDSASYELTQEIVQQLEQHNSNPLFRHGNQLAKDFEQARKIPRLESLSLISKEKAVSRRKKEFLKEWSRALQYIRDIAARIVVDGVRPAWIPASAPSGAQADQFLHAYYYNCVMDGHRARHHEFHEKNRKDPEGALSKAIQWWSRLPSAPSQEDRMINQWAPFIAARLKRDRVLSLTEGEFVDVISKVHAFKNYADRAKYTTLGLSKKLPAMSSEQRSVYLAKRVFQERNAAGEDVRALLHEVLYGGPVDEVPDRVFDAAYQPGKRIRHMGLSTFGEIAGWGMPDRYPPRNGRTSKALFALGYDVVIHTE